MYIIDILFIFRGARHGLRATGKLARIAEQEKILLTQPQYQGYSHAKKLKQKADERIDQMTIEEDVPAKAQKKKKKRKRCSTENVVESERSMSEENIKSENGDASEDENVESGRNSEPMTVCGDEDINDNEVKKSKKKKKQNNLDLQDEVSGNITKKKKKKKGKIEKMDF